jgi:hypothetical protein
MENKNFINYKEKTNAFFEELRDEFINNPEYRGLDLNFESVFMMKTGLSLQTFNELNNLSNQYNKNKFGLKTVIFKY